MSPAEAVLSIRSYDPKPGDLLLVKIDKELPPEMAMMTMDVIRKAIKETHSGVSVIFDDTHTEYFVVRRLDDTKTVRDDKEKPSAATA